MADDEGARPEDDFQEMLRRLLGGEIPGELDPEMLSRMSGMQIDPAMMQAAIRHLQQAFASGDEGGVAWDMATRQALHIANQDGLGISGGQRADLDQAFALATLWLGEATTIPDLAKPPTTLTRGGWVEATLPVWQELAEPVAASIADALTAALDQQVPEDMREMVQGAGRVMRTVGGSLFATQLGQVVGNLSKEVVSGGDVGIPLLADGDAAILPQNFADFGRDLEIPEDQLALAVAARELAHARLFRHARWLRLDVLSQVRGFARGIRVDTDALDELAARFDPSDPEELRRALESGQLLPQRSPEQDAALARLENVLATIEGWVDVVTADATSRLPSAAAINETVRRRRAVGGPAEKALGSLVGLELRPRRMREAAAMWRQVTDAVGVAARDALWDYPDLMPDASDIDDPAALIARLQARARGEEPARDEMDDALAALLDGSDGGGGGEGGAAAGAGALDEAGADAEAGQDAEAGPGAEGDPDAGEADGSQDQGPDDRPV